jgi:3-methyladenine DNA glycosylase AlkD
MGPVKERSASPPLLQAIRGALKRVADPSRAPAMQAYMKSTMPFLGVTAPGVRVVSRELFASYPFGDAVTWRSDALASWRAARYREERYVVIALTGHRKAKPFQRLDALPMYEEMIVTGAWWDYVDSLAAHRIGPLLEAHPREMRKTMLGWSRSDDMWKRRTSILCQLLFRESTDLDLLYDCMEPSLSSKEFFLRKAIGWALRQVARHDPAAVIRYVAAHEGELSGLTKREALKHVGGTPASAPSGG